VSAFTCAVCRRTYEKGLSDEQAEAQLERTFPGAKMEDCDLVCDDCFIKHFGWAMPLEASEL
jgi:hypothetical protein